MCAYLFDSIVSILYHGPNNVPKIQGRALTSGWRHTPDDNYKIQYKQDQLVYNIEEYEVW